MLAVGAVVFSSATGVSAQALYYRSVPVGERAVGLGGAFTGVASDPSSTYYNPGGMTYGERFELLGSFSSLVLTRKRFDNAFDTPAEQESFETKNTTSLPRFIGTIVQFGKPKHGRRHPYALGYSTLEVARDSLGDGVTENSEALSLDIRINNDYRARWYGLSFGAQVTERSSVGFTIYLSDQQLGYREVLGIATGGTFDPERGLRIDGESVSSSGDARVTAYHFVPRLGWLMQITDRWRFGVMFQTPGIPLKQKGDLVRQISTNLADENAFLLVDTGDTSANLPIPFELRVGFGFQINRETLLSVDAAVAGPVGDKDVLPRPQEFIILDRGVGVYFPDSTKRRWTPNFAIGADHRFGPVVIAGGLFTNISAAPDVPSTSDVYFQDQVNMYGAAFSIGVDAKGYRLTMGATTMYGKGKALGVTIDPQTEVVGYAETDASRFIIAMYIAGAVSVAAKGAKDVSEAYKVRKARKRKENGEGDTDAEDDTLTSSDSDSDR